MFSTFKSGGCDGHSEMMSLHDHLSEDAKQNLRQLQRDMQRQRRLMDLRLQQLREQLPASWPHRSGLFSCYVCPPSLPRWERSAVTTQLDVDQEPGSMPRRLNRMSDSSHDHQILSLIDMEGFDPKEITVTVKDGKVKVLAEHSEELTTARGKDYTYKKLTKEISLPPGLSEDKVIWSLGPDIIMKIETTDKCCSCLLRH